MISPTGFALPAEDEEEDGDSPLRNIRNSLCLFKVQAALIEEEEIKKSGMMSKK
jgi:hypothetical protein